MLEDGSYFIVTLQAIETRTNATISGNKSYSYYTNNGELKWTAVVHGTFTYTGISAVCTASSCDVTIYDAGWYVASKNVGKNANAATVDLAVSKKVLGITVDTVSVSLTLRCDKYGKLS